MLIYILKSAACLAILLTFYKLFMENESMHTLKRFYLLGALALALAIPFVTFVEYIEIPLPATITTAKAIEIPAVMSLPQEQTPIDYLPLVLSSIYVLGALLYAFKFARNLVFIIQRIRKNPWYRVDRIYNVLLSESVVPHTFLSYIFLNKQKYEARQIPQEVLLHEETHAKQKHSWDVLFIEFLQIIFWFNPLIFIFKKAIKLNHEFLADQAVLQNNRDPVKYQHILLNYSSPNNQSPPVAIGMANAINYSSIKKRFTVMKKQTSKKGVLLRSLLLLPLLVLLTYGFSKKKEVLKNNSSSHINTYNQESSELVDFEILVTNTKNGIKLNCIDGCAWRELEFTLVNEHRQLLDAFGMSTNSKNEKIKGENFSAFLISLQKTNGELILKGIRGTAWTDLSFTLIARKVQTIDQFGVTSSFKQEGASRKQIEEYNVLAKKYYGLSLGNLVSRADMKRKTYLFNLMSEKQKEAVDHFPDIRPMPTSKYSQKGASRKLMAEYNKLAKYYNNMSSTNMRITKKDVDRLTYIYALMSKKQKADAEPFPNFPELPPVPKAPELVKNSYLPPPPPISANATEEEKKIYKEVIRNYKNGNPGTITKTTKNGETIDVVRIVKDGDIPPPPPPPTNQRVSKGERSNIPPPPPPPKPVSPLDHAIAMAKKNAQFYYEGKKISSDKAIELLKKNDEINIDSRASNGKRPVVKLTTAPINH